MAALSQIGDCRQQSCSPVGSRAAVADGRVWDTNAPDTELQRPNFRAKMVKNQLKAVGANRRVGEDPRRTADRQGFGRRWSVCPCWASHLT
jgi:hypothetical protein